MPEFYKFPNCDCKFKILGPPPLPKSDIPSIDLDWDNVPLDCPITYDLLCTGKTKMVFQLEKGGGRQGCRELKPAEIEHMAGLGAVLRPGAANSYDEDGVSTTKHYYLRKNGLEEIKSYHPALDSILGETYNCLIYQEQAMKIAEKIAGFNKKEADNLRKAIGKKLPEEMAKVKKWFIDGAKKVGVVTEAQAEEIFGWIKESQKYSFNKSHALCYGITGYQCGYAKAHFPVQAYTSWLRYGQDKGKPLEEYAELVDDAKIFGIEVYPPDIRDLELNFYTNGEIINYGLSNIKGVGEKTGAKVLELIKGVEKETKPIKQWSWYDFLVLVGSDIGKTVMERLILTGGLRGMDVMRVQMLKEYEAFAELKPGEIKWIKQRKDNWNNIIDALEAVAHTKKNGGGAHTESRVEKIKSRLSLLKNPIIPYRDNPTEIANDEQQYLGTSITCSLADGKPGERWTVYCRDCVNETLPKVIILKVKVEEVRENIIKKGKEENIGKTMAYLRVSDSTCSLSDISCFPESWDEYKSLLTVGRVLEIHLEKSFKGNRLHVKNVWAI